MDYFDHFASEDKKTQMSSLLKDRAKAGIQSPKGVTLLNSDMFIK
jgi:hypothetical protein